MKKNKKIGVIILSIIGGVLLILFLLGIYAKQKVKSLLDDDLSNFLQYEEVDVSLINRRISLTNPEITFSANTITAEDIILGDISIYEYLANKKIEIGEVEVLNPNAIFRKSKDTTSGGSNKFKQDIQVHTLNIQNGKIRTFKNDTSTAHFFALLESLKLQDIKINSETVQQKLPFNYKSYSLKVDSLKMPLNDEHNFSIGSLTGENGKLNLERVRIIPKYDKVEFQRQIPYEKDRMDLLIQSVQMDSLTWGYENDSLQIKNPLLTIKDADLEIYRNKLVKDDPRQKKLYSEGLRQLPIKLDLDSVHVENSMIVYEEKVKESRPPGKISFHEIEGKIANVSNIGLGEENMTKTVVEANALYMNVTPLELDWEFDISNEWEAFTISGTFGSIPGSAINEFVRPAMNVELEGNIDALSFTYSGNDNKAVGDARIKYKDFKVIILEDNGTEKSSFWSSLANLFINNTAVDEEVTNKDLEVTRNKNKSFWNYVWLMVREAALASFL